VVADHHHLGVVGQVDRQHRTVTADHPAQTIQAGVAAHVASGQPVSMGHDILLLRWDTKPVNRNRGDVLLSNRSGTY
jgi:hypothetical protein